MKRATIGNVALALGLVSCDAGRSPTPPTELAQPAQSLIVVPSDTTLTVGQIVALTVTERSVRGIVATPAAVAWSSSNPGVALVTPGGLVVAQGPGSTSITASADGKSATATITVIAPAAPSGDPSVVLAFTRQPTNSDAGAPLDPAVRVTVHDTAGATITTFAGVVTLRLGNSPTAAELRGDTSVRAVAGVATFTNLRITEPGQRLTLIAEGANAARVTSAAFDVAPEALGQLAFVRMRGNAPEIVVINADRSNATALAIPLSFVASPSWSPDGQRLAFTGVATDTSQSQIFVVNADGSGLTQLTRTEEGAHQPAWSPDGKRIAFARNRGGASDVCAINADGTGLDVLYGSEFSVVVARPAWAPDGSRLAFSWGNYAWTSIYTVNADGSGVDVYGHGEPYEFEAWAPAWSPDGERLLFWSMWGGPGLTQANRDGTGAKRIGGTPAVGPGANSAWSPDGSRIAFDEAGTTQATFS